MAGICVHLCSSAVNNEIEIIPACFLSAHALSMGWEWSVQAVASGVVWRSRRRAWLLKYIICVMLLISNELVPTHTNSEFVRVRFEFAANKSSIPAPLFT